MKREIKHINFELIILTFLFLYMGMIFFSIALSNIFMGLAIFAFILGWVKKSIYLNFQKKNIFVFLLLIVPFVLTIFSVLHSNDISNGMRSVRLRIPILILPFIVIFTEFKNKNIIRGFLIFTILASAASLFTLFKATNFIGEGILLQPDFTYFITPIQHPYFGIYLLITLVSVIEFKLFSNKTLNILIGVLLIIGIILSTSRLAYILLFSIVLIYGTQNLNRKNSLMLFIFLLVFSVVFIGINKSIQSKFKMSLTYHNSPRLKLWNNALKVVNDSENQLFGIGIGDYYKVKEDPYFFKENRKGLYGYDPHSQVMDFFITNGYIGLLIMIVSFLIQLVWISKQNKFAIIIFTIISLFALTESILNRQYGVQLYSVFLPLLFINNFKHIK